jgi:hypothetical protein
VAAALARLAALRASGDPAALMGGWQEGQGSAVRAVRKPTLLLQRHLP